MPVTQTGLVYFSDDPTQTVVRIVYPSSEDSELDDPKWVNFGSNQTTAVMVKVPKDNAADIVAGLISMPAQTQAAIQ